MHTIYWSDETNPIEGLDIVSVRSKESLLHLADDGHYRSDLGWSYDNEKLVYLSDYVIYQNIPVFTNIYVIDLQTGEETLIANFEAVQNPRWSPVEDVIAFAGGTLEEMNIYLVRSDGTGLKQLTDSGYYSVGTWSPDGSRLAISAIGDDLTDSEIYILDIESKALERVTENDTFDAHPVWVELEK